MTFLSFYSDHHSGRGNEALVKKIEEKKWADAEFIARTDPLHVGWKFQYEGFVDGNRDSKIYPIHLACINQPPPQMIKVLHKIHKRGIGQTETAYQRLPLHLACLNGASKETVGTLVSLKKSAVKAKDALGRLPIHYAAKDPQMGETVLLLLKESSATATIPDKQGFLPIHIACRFGMPLSVIRVLLRTAPQTLSQKTKKGSTPYQCAKLMKHSHRDEVLGFLWRACNAEASSETSAGSSQDEAINMIMANSMMVRR